MIDLSLKELFKLHVDEYNLASFVDSSLIKMVSRFVQSYSIKIKSSEIDIHSMILEIGGAELLMSSDFCHWLYQILPDMTKFEITDQERKKLITGQNKMNRSFLKKFARLFP